MKIHHPFLSFMFIPLSVACLGQCPKAGTKPVWDSNKSEFRCTSAAAMSGSAQSAIVPPTGDKNSCKSIREDLQKACPSPDEGKACKNAVKSIFEGCYKGSEASSRGSTTSSSPSNRTDTASCMTTYQQQQEACRTRVTPPRAPGQPYTPDTCLSDAMAAQNKCLASAR